MKRRKWLSLIATTAVTATSGCLNSYTVQYLEKDDIPGDGWEKRPAKYLTEEDIGYVWMKDQTKIFIISSIKSFQSPLAAENKIKTIRKDTLNSNIEKTSNNINVGEDGFSALLVLRENNRTKQNIRLIAVFRLGSTISYVSISIEGDRETTTPIEENISQVENLAKKTYIKDLLYS